MTFTRRHPDAGSMPAHRAPRTLRALAGMPALGCALVLYASAVAVILPAKSAASDAFAPGRVLVIAHRGGALEAPENTLYAFEKALRSGADVLEMDIVCSKDGVLAVFHDLELERTTNGSGPVQELCWQELRLLDAAYNWNPRSLPEPPYRGRGIAIPSLEEVFMAFPGTPMIIEIKPKDAALVALLGSLIDRYDRWHITIVASFHQAILERFRSAYPCALTSAGVAEVRNFYLLQAIGLSRLSGTRARFYQVPERRGPVRVLSGSMLRALERRGIDVHVWVVNEEPAMRRLMALGVAGIITDRPSVLAGIVRSHGLHKPGP